MKPIFFTIDNGLPVKVVPDTQMHLDGHTVLTYNYNIFFDSNKNNPVGMLTRDETSNNIDDPDYMGAISFEKPSHLFTYTPGKNRTLTRDEIEEIIERLSDYRNSPNKWTQDDLG